MFTMKKVSLLVLATLVSTSALAAGANARKIYIEGSNPIAYGDPAAKVCVSGFAPNSYLRIADAWIENGVIQGFRLNILAHTDAAGSACRSLYVDDVNAPRFTDRQSFPIAPGKHTLFVTDVKGKTPQINVEVVE